MPTPTAGEDSNLFIGLMSGTSVDSIDAVLVEFTGESPALKHAINFPLDEALRASIIDLCSPGHHEIDRMGATDRELGHALAKASHALLKEAGISASQINAIGSHGQTIRHRPALGTNSFTLQIGDPNTIAQATGICTVADFRRRDMAAGGQGAPLAPAFHHAVFRSDSCNRAIVNIGGISNVTALTRTTATFGFDTGPGNVLLDAWIQRQRGQSFDRDGAWAASGQVIPELLEKLMAHSFFELPPPKSTGREDFNLSWLQDMIGDSTFSPENIQATLLDFTAHSISKSIDGMLEEIDEVYICGGGAYNKQLMARLTSMLTPRQVCSTAALGIAAEWVEGVAFAWLARQTLLARPGNLAEVTGASQATILGGIYPAG